MESLLYLLKASAGLVLLYAVYWVFLRQHTYFMANRCYLLMAVMVALLAPLFEIKEQVVAAAATATVQFEAGVVGQPVEQEIDFTQILFAIYTLGIVAMLARLGRMLGQIISIIATNPRERVGKYTLVKSTNSALSSFSFLNYVVISSQDEVTHADVVLRHEEVHIRQWHSLDLLLLEMLHVLFWFNPVLIFYKRSMRQIHEFIADEQATAGDRLTYARALVGYTFGVSPLTLTNNFFDSSQLKNRIVMLTKNRSSRWVLTRYFLAIPALVALVLFVAARTVETIPPAPMPAQNTTASPLAEELPLVSVPANVQTDAKTAENITVSGQVLVKADKTPLPGATIVVIGETKGTVTDVAGRFAIQTTTDKELAVSFVGFKTQVISLKKMKEASGVSVFLEKETKELNEVVVVTYVPEQVANTQPALPPPPPSVAISKNDDEVFAVVEQQPEFPGGTKELMTFLAKNIKYPAPAVRASVQGKVFVQFVVNKTGNISDIKILKGIGFGCDEEAVRVVSIMPKWKPAEQRGQPVAMQYNLPISFMLESRFPNAPIRPNGGNNDPAKQALFILDGVEMKDGEITKINPNDIEKMEVLKNENATKIYGEKGKNGVILITTKKKAAEKKD
jgi:TonB family protein